MFELGTFGYFLVAYNKGTEWVSAPPMQLEGSWPQGAGYHLNATYPATGIASVPLDVAKNPGIPRGSRSWLEPAPFDKDGVNTEWRMRRWGVVPFASSVYGSPFTLNLRIAGHYYSVPDLWIQVADNGDWRINNNWGTYESFNPNVAGQQMEVYAYESANTDRPVVLSLVTANKPVGSGTYVVTQVKVVRPIFLSADTASPSSFVDEFNYKLAKMRRDQGCVDAYITPYYTQPWSGFLGWQGKTSHVIKGIINDPNGKTHWDSFDDPIFFMSQGPMGGVCRDMYVISLGSGSQEVDYSQQFTVINDTDNTQTVKSSDFSHAIATSHSETWGSSDQVSAKVAVTVKWENSAGVDCMFFKDQMKFSLQIAVEAGYTRTWTRSTTDTTTETKTYTMPGQSVSLPSKTAATIESTLLKVRGTGTIGYAVEITDTPKVYVGAVGQSLYETGVYLDRAVNVLDLKTVASGWKSVQDGKTYPGAFVKPTMSFDHVQGSAGSTRILPAPYAPPKGEGPGDTCTVTSGPKG